MTLTPKREAWLHAKRGEKYTPPKLTPEEEHKKRAETRWHAELGLRDTRRALERANTKTQRQAAEKAIKVFEEMLAKNQ